MKKYLAIITLLGMSVFVVQCMEDNRKFKDTGNPCPMKKIKSHNNPVVNNEIAKTLVCSYCEVRFLNKNNLTAHQTFSYCAKKLQEKKNS